MIHLFNDVDPVSGNGPWYLAGVVVPSLFAYLANRSAKRAKTTTEQVKESVGVANGATLLELAQTNHEILRQTAQIYAYSQTRNHDILDAISEVKLAAGILTRQLEMLLTTLPPRQPRPSPRRGGNPPASQSTEDEQ